MFKHGRQEQKREVYDIGEWTWDPYTNKEMEKMENLKKASQELEKMLYNETLQQLSIFILLKED